MTKPQFDERASARPDLLCLLVAIAAASYALTNEWRVTTLLSAAVDGSRKMG
jgi:hypothetical protein